MKKILVLGIKGMAGHVVFKSLSTFDKYDVYGIARNVDVSKKIFNLDVTNVNELKKIIDLKFDVIINCIGILNKDAEDNPHKAIWFNSYFPHFLEAVTKSTETKVITLSTDCVFSGKKGDYFENDIKDGEGFYAQSKATGEIDNNKDLTIRTSIIGPELKKDGIGLFHWFMNQENEIHGFTEAYWTGVTTIELAHAIHQAIQQNITGLYHLVNNDKISKYDLLDIINKVFRNNSVIIKPKSDYKVDKSLINTRNDFSYNVPSYESMIKNMKVWIENHKEHYQHYRF